MSYDNPYCADCDRYFSNWSARDQHFRDAVVHRQAEIWTGGQSQGYYNDYEEEERVEDEVECHGCRQWFNNMNDFDRHFATSSRHNWCFECSKDFSSPHALQQHESSRVHAARDFDCPLCGQGFKQPSAIAHHVESGSCPRAPGVHRHQVTNAVHNLNIAPTISISRRITGGPGSSSTPLITYTATDRAWNYDINAYECYLCHRTFGALNALNTHLNSPAHDRDEFRCPKPQCGRQFKVISALVQHIESEACGLARFQQIEDHTRALTSQFPRMLTY
ncbi:hypothetical protein PENSPDRAFT_752398 [Peniophora sp. CONT]|nr:hypothetical protein PENSPDRAFT_752398 [Peniophora sp. CONT]